MADIGKNAKAYSNMTKLRSASIASNFYESSDDPPPPPPLPGSKVESQSGSSTSPFTTLQPLSSKSPIQPFPLLEEVSLRPLPLRERLPFQLISETGMFTTDGNLVAGNANPSSKPRKNFTKVRRLGVLRNKNHKVRKKIMKTRRKFREKHRKKFRKEGGNKLPESSSSSSKERSSSSSFTPASKITTKSRKIPRRTLPSSEIKFIKLSTKVKSHFKAISSSEASNYDGGSPSSKNVN